MLEITTCNINDEEVIHFDIKKYLGNEKFHEDYIKIKFMARRIWFGFYNATYELADFLVIHKISADMAAVIIKYSLPKWMVVEAIEKVSDALVERCSTLSDELRKYAIWLTNATSIELTRIKYGKFQFERTQSDWKKLRESSDKIHIIDLDLSVLSVASIQTEKLNNHKFAFIMCVNDDNYCEEVIAYINCLDIPKGYVADIINVRNAKGMAAGYNTAMRFCDARYKIYLHQDTFIINPNFLHDLLNIYNKEDAPSMIGAAGCKKISPEGIWWNSNSQDVRMTWYQDGILTILESNSAGTCDDEKEINAGYKEVSCLDGILIATSQDIPWREDLFDGWHFYDISQGFEFKKNNLKVACIVAHDMCIVHETTMRKDPSNAYEYYRKIFLKEYQTLLN